MAEWSRILNTTIRDYIRTEEVNVLRNRKLTALLKEKGRITFGHSGEQMDWKVNYKMVGMSGYADMDTLTFARKDQWKTANLPWRGYAITQAISKKERLMNKGTEAIIKLYDGMAKRLMRDLEEQFGEELYKDGTQFSSKGIHGIESFLTAASNIGSGGLVGAPTSTFAGLDCTLGAYGGSWTPPTSKQWPEGRGDASQTYDFWSPIVVDVSAAGWTASTKTWPNTCLEALRFGILMSQRSKSRRGMMDLIIMGNDLFRPFLDKLATNERIVVERGKKQSPLIALGYDDVVSYDGVEHTWEYGIPGATAYGFNCDEMELRSLQDQLFVPVGPVYDEATMTYRFSIDFFGNCTWNPRSFAAWKKIT